MFRTKPLLLALVFFNPVFTAAQTQLQFPGPAGTTPVRILFQPSGNTVFVGTSAAPYSGVMVWPGGSNSSPHVFQTGGSKTDTPKDATLDSNGNIWIVGDTNSDDFPLVNPIVSVNPAPGRAMGFVMELDPTGSTVKFASYLGGAEPYPCGSYCSTQATAIAADALGNVYVGGSTDESNFPVTAGAWLTTGPSADAFGDKFSYSYVAKISAAGKLIWATYLGTGEQTCVGGSGCLGHSSTSANVDSLAVDSTGAVTASESMSLGPGRISRLAQDASTLLWTTDTGKQGGTIARLLLAQDASENVTLFGEFASVTLVGEPIVFSAPYLFAEKLSSSGTLINETDLGAASADAFAAGIFLDSEGNTWLSGTDSSQSGPLAGAANAGADFLLEVAASGNASGPPVRFPRGVVAAGASVTAQGQVLIPGANGALLTLLSGFSTQISAIVGFTNSASFAMNTGIYPGALVSIFGFGLPATAPQITMNGIPAPVLYSGANQINVQVPFEISVYASPTLQISWLTGNLSAQLPVSRALGIFTVDGIHAAALNQDGTVNSAGNPASKGSIVTFYGTGARWDNQLADDVIATAASPLNQEENSLQFVDANGVPAFIQYAGAAPGIIIGVFQINVAIPAGALQPFTLQSLINPQGVLSSNAVEIYVQ